MQRFICLLPLIVFAATAQPPAAPILTHGIASGDVTDRTAILWGRASSTSTLEVEYSTDADFARRQNAPSVRLSSATDFTEQVSLSGLRPATRYYYRVRVRSRSGASPQLTGSFVTAPPSGESRDVGFLWAGDLGGQGFCRRPEQGYTIFDSMTSLSPDFVLFSGDMIYADVRCPAPPCIPGADFVSSTLEEFRQRWKYNREDHHHQKLLASTSMVTQWDDHEVRNDFDGPFEPLMQSGRQAYFEYHPIARNREEPGRIYRKFRWGRELELFVLDNRQYRSPKTQADGSAKSMLSRRQFHWLAESLSQSGAVWKVIATSVPLTVGIDGWANGSTVTHPQGNRPGWETELLSLFAIIRERGIRNVIWITTDVHFAQIARLDPFGDGNPLSYEFISGPLSAVSLKPGELDTTLRPTRLYAEGELFNFGRIRVDAKKRQLTTEIRAPEPAGRSSIRYSLTIDAVR